MYNEIIVNKRYKLNKDFIPKDMIEINEPTGDKLDSNYVNMLDKEAYQNFKLMQSAAEEEGLFIWIDSSFRTYLYQQEIFNECVKEIGIKEASVACAEPGTSEHQTGLAIDIIFSRNGRMYLQQKESDPEIIWLMENSYL
ncbi:MAG: M15 family metallopeptidase, partial [Bacilli bacterium]